MGHMGATRTSKDAAREMLRLRRQVSALFFTSYVKNTWCLLIFFKIIEKNSLNLSSTTGSRLSFISCPREKCTCKTSFICYSAPFTIQRLCELIVEPEKHYKRIDKFMRALEKNLQIVTTVSKEGRWVSPLTSKFFCDLVGRAAQLF